MSDSETPTETETTDVVLVGAGPIGLELAVALQRAGLDYLHFEAHQIGHTISWFAPHTPFFSSPERIALAGVPLVTVDQTKATREEYLAYLRAVVEQFDLSIATRHRIASAQALPEGGFRLALESPSGVRTVRCRRLILAIGDMHRPRLLGVPGEDLPHVSHYFQDPHLYFRHRVLIVGGKNSAVEAAIRCCRVGAQVSLSYHRADLRPERIKFWLLPEIRAMVREQRVRFLPSTRVQALYPDKALLAQGTSTDADDADGTTEALEVPTDHVLLMIGYIQDADLYRQLGVQLRGPGNRPHLDSATMETNVAGLYLAGTGAAGTQLEGVKEFIETSHVHVDRILDALQGRKPRDLQVPEFELSES